MQVYEMTKSGRRGVLITRTVEGVLLKMLDNQENKEITESTLKRWWKKVEVETPVIAEVAEPVLVPQAEPEVIEPPKALKAPKVTKPTTKKVAKEPVDNQVKAFVEFLADNHGCTLYSGKVKAFVSIKLDGKAALVFTHNAKGITLWVREALVPNHTAHTKKAHLYGARITLTNPINDTKKDIITELFNASYTYLKTKSA